MTIPNWRILLVEAAALLVATFVFSIFCIAPLKSMQGNQALQSEFGLAPNEEPPPPWILPFDDSYIFIRYAQQAHRGNALQWNTGEASSGASSFLYPWILLPGQWLYDDIQGWSWWSRAVGIAGLWILGVVTVLLMRTLGLAGLWPLATGLAVLWSGPVGFGAMTGMESALNAAALLLALTLWSKLSRRRHAVTATLFFLLVSFLPLLRPENLLLTLIGSRGDSVSSSGSPAEMDGSVARHSWSRGGPPQFRLNGSRTTDRGGDKVMVGHRFPGSADPHQVVSARYLD